MNMKIQILNQFSAVLIEAGSSCGAVTLLYDQEYQEGDFIRFIPEKTGFFEIVLDDTLGRACIYMTASSFDWKIPFDLIRKRYNPRAFAGTRHYITVQTMHEWKHQCARNLSCNIYDTDTAHGVFPHAWSNVITAGKPEFDAQNAIDGILYPWAHGRYPYESWGINQRQDAEWHLDFGRNIIAEKIIITLRADFPHDSYWKTAELDLSNGEHLLLNLQRTGDPQEFTLPFKPFSSLKISHLERGDLDSPFPALCQVQVFGMDE